MSDPDDLLAVIPHLLRYHPQESLVVVPLGSGLPTARVDLPRSDAERDGAADALVSAYLRNAGPESRVALVVYSESGQAAEEASGHVAGELRAHGLPVEFRVWATDGDWTDLDTGAGGPRTERAQTHMDARFVALGRRSPAPTRDGLGSVYAGDPGPVAAELPAAIARAQARPASAQHAWLEARITRFESDGNRLSDTDAARLLVAVQRPESRDAALNRMNQHNAVEHRALWTDMTARAPDEVRTPAATLAGFASWLEGDGAGAWTALDQVPEPPPGDRDHQGQYRLAAMLSQALAEAVPPSSWDDSHPSAADRAASVAGDAYDPREPSTTPQPQQSGHGPRPPEPPSLGEPPPTCPRPSAP